MSKKNNNSFNNFVAILSILFVVAIVGFVFKFTNGFNEDLKTFYIEHNDKQILATDSQMTFNVEKEYRFDCKYISTPEDNTFNLKVVPNATEETNFNYTVDGELCKWSDVKDLTSFFTIDKQENYFTILFPASFSIEHVLNCLYPEREVVILDDLLDDQYYYTLHVSNYNEKVNYYIYFKVNVVVDTTISYDISFVVDSETVKTESIFENSLITPPESPAKSGYTFDGWVNTNNSIVDFTTYTACENTTFTANFILNTINVAFEFYDSSSSSGDSGIGATPYWGSVDDGISYGSISPKSVELSVENQNSTVTFTLNSGYTYEGYEVNNFSSSGGTVTPYALTTYPFGVSVSGDTITLTLSSVPSTSSYYTLSIIVTGTGSSSGGSDSGGMVI